MKAIRIHGSGDVRLDDVPIPKLADDDVLIRVRAAGICGTDLELLDGTAYYVTSGKTKLTAACGRGTKCSTNSFNGSAALGFVMGT